MKNRYTLQELATLIDARIMGDPHHEITGIATLQSAQPGDISFLDNPKYQKFLPDTKASVVILSAENAVFCTTNALVTQQPYLGYAKIADLFNALPKSVPGIHPTAVIMDGCEIHPSSTIAANVVIESGCQIGEGVIIGPGCTLGENVQIGAHTRLWANVTIYHHVLIGQRTLIHSGAVIGSDGFGFAKHQGAWHKIPQIGRVVIGDDVEIGANTTIDRGALDDTVIEQGVKLDNQIQVGHNVSIGEGTAIAACTGISGSVKIGKRCMISGMVGFTGHFEVADNVVITGMTMVSKGLSKPGMYSSGTPIESHDRWKKNAVRFRQLDDMAKRIRELEKKINALILQVEEEKELL